MAPSFLSWAKALSTSLRSSPERVATSPADTGLPALRIVSRTFAVVSIFFCLFDVVVLVSVVIICHPPSVSPCISCHRLHLEEQGT